MSLFIPTYFSPISQYMTIANSDKVLFETEDNFQKQTYRNLCYILGSNGKLLLNIPVKHTSTSSKKKTKDTLV
ncbi:MAG: WbqC family protein, partial [Polaribacter sp.]|nr:WbqC family protein [Polaribacter sp.]